MQLLREIDFKQTGCNTRDVLKNFRRLERMIGRSLIDIKSPIITDIPKAPKHGNRTEDVIIQMMDTEAERDVILAALMALSLISRQILYYSSCVLDSLSNHRTSREVGYSERGMQRMKLEALIELAEAYKHGRITAYKQGDHIMWKDYVSPKELKKDLVFKRIVGWSESELILKDGTKMEVVCSESDCYAWTEGEFKNVKLDAVITDIKVFDKGNCPYNGDEHTSYTGVVIYHNRNETVKAECTANDGNGGYYYSVCALKVKDKLRIVTDA